ncbi:MAG TPA: acetyl-CoA carboxylase biotin carboxyl carrier protein subunit [Thermoplasmata archaeon]|jgi:3-methylcrotonyl-CoA carboxylase alpha subunit|nr:MAG TPA: acetyl-CoA carboxylase biotin carboxyl carrier protein subunit [Thermoplasmata archaeon]
MFINYEHNNHVYNITVERRENQFFIVYDNNEYTVSATELKPGQLAIQLGDRVIKSVISQGGDNKFVFIDGSIFKVKRIELTGRKTTEKKEGDLHSPISGTIVAIKVREGSLVKKDDVLLVIEAMKMEYLIRAPYDGKVKKVHFKEKEQIEIGQLTAEIKKEVE